MPTVQAPAVVIRLATAEDPAQVVAVAVASGLFDAESAGVVGELMQAYVDHAADEGHVCLVAEEDGSLTGVAYAQPAPVTDRTWYLTMLAVRAAGQGRGTGGALVRATEEHLASSGQRLLLIETSGVESFERTRAFYVRLGYEEAARVRDFYAAGDDMVLFRKALQL